MTVESPSMLLSTLKKVMFVVVLLEEFIFTGVLHIKSHLFCTSSYWWSGKRYSSYVLLS